MRRNIIFILLLLVITAYTQNDRIMCDSLIFKDDSNVEKYPFAEKYDSLRNIINKEIDSLKSNSFAFVDYFPPKPEVYAVVNDSIYSIKKFNEYLKENFIQNIRCIIRLKIHWNGYISEARVVSYKGNFPEIYLLKDIVQKIRAKPAINEGNFPDPGPFNMSLLINTN